MSLVGIDVGSSSVKVAAYSEAGKLLAVKSHELTGLHPAPGWWEQDPEEIWEATSQGILQLGREDSVRRDPPQAMAISASGRENFLADEHGNPLARGIMGADTRGEEFDVPPAGSPEPEPWCLSCGHLRERMDPVFRLAWWRKYHPEVVAKAKHYLGWHDFLTLRMCGRRVADRSTASRYLVYDLHANDWSAERMAEHQLSPDLLPEVLPWPALIGEIRPEVAAQWRISPRTRVGLGGHDVNCATVGAGATAMGEACLISGSYENLMVMTGGPPTAKMLLRGVSVMPHPGAAGFAALAVSPTGNAVLNWVRDLVGASIQEVEAAVERGDLGPAPVLAVPYLSGSMAYWEGGRRARGALAGLTLATSRADIVQAFMESIAYDHANTLRLLNEEGVTVNRIRAVGGGARSVWWTQLKADITNLPIEVVEKQEAGTLGAAILAGLATGVYADLQQVSRAFSGTIRVHAPDPGRAERHRERLEAYRSLVPTLLSTIYRDWR